MPDVALTVSPEADPLAWDAFVEACPDATAYHAWRWRPALEGVSLLEISAEAEELAARLLGARVVPRKATVDALHVAIAVVHGMHYLLTWNCAHIANAAIRGRIEIECRRAGFEPPAICTPEELMGDGNGA